VNLYFNFYKEAVYLSRRNPFLLSSGSGPLRTIDHFRQMFAIQRPVKVSNITELTVDFSTISCSPYCFAQHP